MKVARCLLAALCSICLQNVSAQVVELTLRISLVEGGAAQVLVSNSVAISGIQFNLVDEELGPIAAEGDFEDFQATPLGDVSDWNTQTSSTGTVLAFAITPSGNILLPASSVEVAVFELEGLQSSDGTQLCVDKVVATKESVVPGGSAVYLDVGCDVPGVEISPSIVTENGEIDVFVTTSEPMSGFQFNVVDVAGSGVEIVSVSPGTNVPDSFEVLSSGSTVLAFSVGPEQIPVLSDQLLATVVVDGKGPGDALCLGEQEFFMDEGVMPVGLKSLPFNPCSSDAPSVTFCSVLGKAWQIPCFFDITEDNIINVSDILGFVEQLLGGPNTALQMSSSSDQCPVLGKQFTLSCSYDANEDGQVDVFDIAGNGGIVQAILYDCYIGSLLWDTDSESCDIALG